MCEICSGQSGVGKGFSSSALVFPVIICILMLHTHLHLYATVVIGISEESNAVSLFGSLGQKCVCIVFFRPQTYNSYFCKYNLSTLLL